MAEMSKAGRVEHLKFNFAVLYNMARQYGMRNSMTFFKNGFEIMSRENMDRVSVMSLDKMDECIEDAYENLASVRVAFMVDLDEGRQLAKMLDDMAEPMAALPPAPRSKPIELGAVGSSDEQRRAEIFEGLLERINVGGKIGDA